MRISHVLFLAVLSISLSAETLLLKDKSMIYGKIVQKSKYGVSLNVAGFKVFVDNKAIGKIYSGRKKLPTLNKDQNKIFQEILKKARRWNEEEIQENSRETMEQLYRIGPHIVGYIDIELRKELKKELAKTKRGFKTLEQKITKEGQRKNKTQKAIVRRIASVKRRKLAIARETARENLAFFTDGRILDILLHDKEKSDLWYVAKYIKETKPKDGQKGLEILKARIDGTEKQQASLYLMIALLREGYHTTPITIFLEKMHKEQPDLEINQLLWNNHRVVKKWSTQQCPYLIALGRINTPESLAFLQKLAKTQRGKSRFLATSAITALGLSKSKKAISLLKILVDDKDYTIARQSIMAFAHTEDETLVPVLLEILKKIEDRIDNMKITDKEKAKKKRLASITCFWSMEKITGARIKRTAWAWEKWWENRQKDLEELQDIYEYLESDEEKEMLEGLERLARKGDKKSVERVLPLLESESVKVRAMSSYVLALIGGIDVASELIVMMRDEEPAVIDKAHQGLKKLTRWTLPANSALWSIWWEAYQSAGHEKLLNILFDGDVILQQIYEAEQAKQLIRNQLSEQGQKNALYLLQRMAVRQLVRKRMRNTIPDLRNLLNDIPTEISIEESQVLIELMYALQNFRDWQSIPYLIDRLQSENTKIKEASYIALKRISRQRLAMKYNDWYDWWQEESAKNQ